MYLSVHGIEGFLEEDNNPSDAGGGGGKILLQRLRDWKRGHPYDDDTDDGSGEEMKDNDDFDTGTTYAIISPTTTKPTTTTIKHLSKPKPKIPSKIAATASYLNAVQISVRKKIPPLPQPSSTKPSPPATSSSP